jgi:hypothetical protein
MQSRLQLISVPATKRVLAQNRQPTRWDNARSGLCRVDSIRQLEQRPKMRVLYFSGGWALENFDSARGAATVVVSSDATSLSQWDPIENRRKGSFNAEHPGLPSRRQEKLCRVCEHKNPAIPGKPTFTRHNPELGIALMPAA